MFRTAPSIVALVLLVAAGVFQTLRTTTASTSKELAALAARLDEIPLVIGDWQAEPSEQEKDQLTMRIADAAGMIQRLYHNTRNGSDVQIMLLVGRPGPLSVHLPEVCYRGSGFRTRHAIEERAIEAGAEHARFRVVDMEHNAPPVPRYIRVYHSWNDGTGWAVPSVPRLAFARSAFLYKLYVTTVPTTTVPGDADPASQFIESWLPVIKDVLGLGRSEQSSP